MSGSEHERERPGARWTLSAHLVTRPCQVLQPHVINSSDTIYISCQLAPFPSLPGVPLNIVPHYRDAALHWPAFYSQSLALPDCQRWTLCEERPSIAEERGGRHLSQVRPQRTTVSTLRINCR